MKLIFLTDTHWRDEEPFYMAAVEMARRLPDEILRLAGGEDFVLVHGGDVFHRSKETGRVNGVVLKFFSYIQNMQNCRNIYVIQGNHDVKKDTGSALGCLASVERLEVIDRPRLVPLWDSKFLYVLPYMPPYSEEGYKSVASYGDPEYTAYQKTGLVEYDDIALTSAHLGDETGGDFFMQADISYITTLKCNGHIHKAVSANYPGSVMITRRDEKDKPCVIRVFDNDFSYRDVEIEPALNYLTVPFDADIGAAVEGMEKKPYGSLIVDVQGHEDEAAVREWFDAERVKSTVPVFLGSVYPDERETNGAYMVEDGDEFDAGRELDLRAIFGRFCIEKNVPKAVESRIEAML
jgi:predicted phosphodiesterase